VEQGQEGRVRSEEELCGEALIIGGLQKMSLIDYPGKVAAVVFARGCTFRCHYCHNPQLVLPEFYIGPISDDYVLNFLRSRRGKLDGVVVTGGEPLMQIGTQWFLRQIRQMGFSVKLDTAGAFPEALQKVVDEGLVDYIAMDVKAPLGRYSEIAGMPVNITAIKRSIGIVMKSNLDYEFRTTVVKDQLSEDDIAMIAESIRGAKSYMLQKFRKGDTIDPAFALKDGYSDEEFERIKESASKFVANCGVR
jgi:pyruvate formate lyase activating enzyme